MGAFPAGNLPVIPRRDPMASHRLIPLTAIGSAAFALQRVHSSPSTAASRLTPSPSPTDAHPWRAGDSGSVIRLMHDASAEVSSQ